MLCLHTFQVMPPRPDFPLQSSASVTVSICRGRRGEMRLSMKRMMITRDLGSYLYNANHIVIMLIKLSMKSHNWWSIQPSPPHLRLLCCQSDRAEGQHPSVVGSVSDPQRYLSQAKPSRCDVSLPGHSNSRDTCLLMAIFGCFFLPPYVDQVACEFHFENPLKGTLKWTEFCWFLNGYSKIKYHEHRCFWTVANWWNIRF